MMRIDRATDPHVQHILFGPHMQAKLDARSPSYT
jgi:hypothetical protein